MMRYVISILGFFLVPIVAYAGMEITEIMYDLEGTDTKREWVELYNSGGSDADLTDWRFNDGSNHILNAPPENGSTGSLVVAPQEYIVLVSDATTFLSEHSGFSGTVIDTVMSLNNTTDTLSLRDGAGVAVDTVSYTSEMGGGGDGNSLQLEVGVWGPGMPTPGASNTTEIIEEDGGGNDTTSEQPPSEPEGGSVSASTHPSIISDAGDDRYGVVGGIMLFDGMGYGFQNKPLVNAKYLWNFGDGTILRGQHVTHTFMYPGIYAVVLDVSSEEFSVSDKVIVEIGEADIEIVYADEGRIEITNNAENEINLSFWNLEYEGIYFMLPKNTILLSKSTGVFPSEATGFSVKEEETISLYYPNGTLAHSHTRPKTVMYITNTPSTYENSYEYVSVSAENSVPKSGNNKDNENSDSSDNDSFSTTTIVASSVSQGGDGSSSSLYIWLLALVGIISIASLLVLSRGKPQLETNKVTADDIKIID